MEPKMITQYIIKLIESHDRLGTASTINVLDVLNTNFNYSSHLHTRLIKYIPPLIPADF